VTQDLIVGLDIGTTKICAVVGEVRDDHVEIVGMGRAPTSGLRKGVVVNIESTVRSIRQAVEEAEVMANCEIQSVYTGVAGAHIRGRNSNGIIAIRDREVNQADVERVIEAAKAVAIPSDREVIHVLPQDFIIDGQDGIKEPVGIHGVRLECKVHIVTAAVTALNNITKCIKKADLEVKGIVLQSLASGEAVLTDEEKEQGVALVDFGGGTSDLAIFADFSLRYNSVLPFGGNHLTNDIAAWFQTSLQSAEELKKQFGCCLHAIGDPEEILEVPGLGGRRARSLPRRELAEIIDMRLTEILGMIGKEIQRAGTATPLLSGAVITGGTSLVRGLPELCDDLLRLPTRLGYPIGVGGMADVINDPSYATAVGLVLYGYRKQKEKAKGTRRDPYQTGKDTGFWGRIKKWFKEVV
jgi:cell division protein FtsA